MLTRFLNRKLSLMAVLTLLVCTSIANAQGTAFTYQGKLSNADNPANGSYDMQFKVFDALTDGAPQGMPVTHPTVQVTAGAFTVELDFGAGVFDGAPRFLEICVRPAGSPDPYTVLAPRQRITSTPYAMHSMKSAAADGLSVACLNCVTSSQIQSVDGAKITGNIAGSQISGEIPTESVPTGSGNYIQNSAAPLQAGKQAPRQAGDFNIAGNGTVGTLNVNGAVTLGGAAPPLPAPAGEGRIYFDTASNKVKVSENGAAFVNLVGAGGVSGSGTTNSIALWTAGTTLGNSLITQSGGNVGIGIGTPTSGRLHVLSSTVGLPGIYGESGTSRGIWGKSVSSRGVYGESSSDEGVHGVSTSGSGVYGETAAINSVVFSGVAGRATGSGGTAVAGLATGTGAFGVYGESATGRAVYGKSVSSRGVYGESNSSEGVFGISNTSTGVVGITNSASGLGGYFQNTVAGGTALRVDGTGKVIFAGGNVGIGTNNPSTRLHIEGTGGVATTIKSPDERAILALDSTLAGQQRVWTLESGFGGTPGLFAIFDQTGGQARLTIDTAGSVGVKVLQIQGGGDFSENFDVRKAGSTNAAAIYAEVQRGLVVSIDQENPGKLVVSRHAYDRSVAGIISGAGGISPGLVMGQKGSIADGKYPVALSGRVWAYCDARRNPIKPGDLLTTSATPGHAMKATNYAKAQGAIIGKAMTALKRGRGLVLVLVSLQ